MTRVAAESILLSAFILVSAAGRGLAQDAHPPPTAGVHAPATPTAEQQEQQEPGQATAPPVGSAQPDWPDPVADSATFGYLLFDLAEFQLGGESDAFRWDVLGWRGGDVHRFWFKSEGRIAAEGSEGTEFEVQGLYGKLISPFFDLQAGVRVDQRLREGSGPTRVHAVIGLQGLSPYRFEIEPSLFLSHEGKVSARLTATYDVLLSQRLILQPRLETNVALQRDEDIDVGAGWNDAEIGVRLRFEVRREFAPHVGATWKESFGATHQLRTPEGGDPSHFAIVAGVRAWF